MTPTYPPLTQSPAAKARVLEIANAANCTPEEAQQVINHLVHGIADDLGEMRNRHAAQRLAFTPPAPPVQGITPLVHSLARRKAS